MKCQPKNQTILKSVDNIRNANLSWAPLQLEQSAKAFFHHHPNLSLLFTRLRLPSLRPLPLLPHTLPRLIHQPIKLATPRQTPQKLHAKRQIIIPPSFILGRPLGAFLLLGVQFAPDGKHGGVGFFHGDGREGVESFGEVGSFVLDHGHEVEFDFGGGVVCEAVLDGVACHSNPIHARCVSVFIISIVCDLVSVFFFVRAYANGTRLQPIQFINTSILLVGNVRDEMKDVVVVGGTSFGL
mmetsp:Transcript_1838/g.3503  ORF Transcript_1838/g.3503 Transcript_1838/m.3503 type:complete len:240 (-) Transcript_1838:685-1404(-)